MNFKFIENIRNKSAQKKQAEQEKQEVQTDKSKNLEEISKWTDEQKRKNPEEFQKLVDKDKSLTNQNFSKGAEVGQKKAEVQQARQQIAQSRADAAVQDLKEGQNKPESAKDVKDVPKHATPVPLRKGKPVHQYETPYGDSSSPKAQEGKIPDNKEVKDWNDKYKPPPTNNLAGMKEAQAAAAKEGENIKQQMEQTKDQDNER